MGNFILIAAVIFIIAAIIAFIFNKKKEKRFETKLDKDVLKTYHVYSGCLTRYVNHRERKTILRYFISGKMNTLNNFTPDDEILVNNQLMLFDKQRKMIALIKDIRKHGIATSILYNDIISLQPVEIAKNKKITRGGISPISIKGYRWASSTTKILKEVERIYIEIKYHALGKEMQQQLIVYDGALYEDRNKYQDIVEEVNTVISKILSNIL